MNKVSDERLAPNALPDGSLAPSTLTLRRVAIDTHRDELDREDV